MQQLIHPSNRQQFSSFYQDLKNLQIQQKKSKHQNFSAFSQQDKRIDTLNSSCGNDVAVLAGNGSDDPNQSVPLDLEDLLLLSNPTTSSLFNQSKMKQNIGSTIAQINHNNILIQTHPPVSQSKQLINDENFVPSHSTTVNQMLFKDNHHPITTGTRVSEADSNQQTKRVNQSLGLLDQDDFDQENILQQETEFAAKLLPVESTVHSVTSRQSQQFLEKQGSLAGSTKKKVFQLLNQDNQIVDCEQIKIRSDRVSVDLQDEEGDEVQMQQYQFPAAKQKSNKLTVDMQNIQQKYGDDDDQDVDDLINFNSQNAARVLSDQNFSSFQRIIAAENSMQQEQYFLNVDDQDNFLSNKKNTNEDNGKVSTSHEINFDSLKKSLNSKKNIFYDSIKESSSISHNEDHQQLLGEDHDDTRKKKKKDANDLSIVSEQMNSIRISTHQALNMNSISELVESMEQIIHGGGSTQLSSARSNRLCDNNDESSKNDHHQTGDSNDENNQNSKKNNQKHDNSEKHDEQKDMSITSLQNYHIHDDDDVATNYDMKVDIGEDFMNQINEAIQQEQVIRKNRSSKIIEGKDIPITHNITTKQQCEYNSNSQVADQSPICMQKELLIPKKNLSALLIQDNDKINFKNQEKQSMSNSPLVLLQNQGVVTNQNKSTAKIKYQWLDYFSQNYIAYSVSNNIKNAFQDDDEQDSQMRSPIRSLEFNRAPQSTGSFKQSEFTFKENEEMPTPSTLQQFRASLEGRYLEQQEDKQKTSQATHYRGSSFGMGSVFDLYNNNALRRSSIATLKSQGRKQQTQIELQLQSQDMVNLGDQQRKNVVFFQNEEESSQNDKDSRRDEEQQQIHLEEMKKLNSVKEPHSPIKEHNKQLQALVQILQQQNTRQQKQIKALKHSLQKLSDQLKQEKRDQYMRVDLISQCFREFYNEAVEFAEYVDNHHNVPNSALQTHPSMPPLSRRQNQIKALTFDTILERIDVNIRNTQLDGFSQIKTAFKRIVQNLKQEMKDTANILFIKKNTRQKSHDLPLQDNRRPNKPATISINHQMSQDINSKISQRRNSPKAKQGKVKSALDIVRQKSIDLMPEKFKQAEYSVKSSIETYKQQQRAMKKSESIKIVPKIKNTSQFLLPSGKIKTKSINCLASGSALNKSSPEIQDNSEESSLSGIRSGNLSTSSLHKNVININSMPFVNSRAMSPPVVKSSINTLSQYLNTSAKKKTSATRRKGSKNFNKSSINKISPSKYSANSSRNQTGKFQLSDTSTTRSLMNRSMVSQPSNYIINSKMKDGFLYPSTAKSSSYKDSSKSNIESLSKSQLEYVSDLSQLSSRRKNSKDVTSSRRFAGAGGGQFFNFSTNSSQMKQQSSISTHNSRRSLSSNQKDKKNRSSSRNGQRTLSSLLYVPTQEQILQQQQEGKAYGMHQVAKQRNQSKRKQKVFEHGMKSIIRSSLKPEKSLSNLSSHSRLVSSSSTSQQSYNPIRKLHEQASSPNERAEENQKSKDLKVRQILSGGRFGDQNINRNGLKGNNDQVSRQLSFEYQEI